MVREQALKIETAAFRKLDDDELVRLRDLLDRALSACRETMTAPPRRVELATDSKSR